MPLKLSPYLPRYRPLADPELQRDLRGAYERVNQLVAQLNAELAKVSKLASSYDFALIRRQLSAGGAAPLNVQGLLGQLAQPQVAGATSVTTLPGPDDPLSQDGSLVELGGQLYVYDESTQTWNTATGSVTSVDADGGTTGYDFSGGPVTGSGTLTMAVNNAATARSAIGIDDIATKLSNLNASAAPTANDDSGDGYAVGSFWFDTTNDQVYAAVDVSVGAAVWKQLS